MQNQTWDTWGTGCAARDAMHPTNLTTEVGPEQRQHGANPQTSGPQQGGNTSRMVKRMQGCSIDQMDAGMQGAQTTVPAASHASAAPTASLLARQVDARPQSRQEGTPICPTAQHVMQAKACMAARQGRKARTGFPCKWTSNARGRGTHRDCSPKVPPQAIEMVEY